MIRRLISMGLLACLLASGSGCAAAIIPSLAGIGAGGYLWGKSDGNDQGKAEEKAAPASDDELSRAAREQQGQ